MKLSGIWFLAVANQKGNRKSNAVVMLTVIFVVSVSLLSSFSVTVQNAVDDYRQSYRGRTLYIYPYGRWLTEEVLQKCRKIEHVEHVETKYGPRFDSVRICDFKNAEELNQKSREVQTTAYVVPEIGEEQTAVIAGRPLCDCPPFSCLLPDRFYPFADDYIAFDDYSGKYAGNLPYYEGEAFIGQSLEVKNDSYNPECNTRGLMDYSPGLSGNDGVEISPVGGGGGIGEIDAPPYILTVVGVYHVTPTTGSYNDIIVSKETGNLIEDNALDSLKIDWNNPQSSSADWRKSPELHCACVTVDNYENIDEVAKALTGICKQYIGKTDLYGIMDENTVIAAAALKIAGMALSISSGMLFVINAVQSAVASLKQRRPELGLMKAAGYKNRWILSCLALEQLTLSIKGLLIGGTFSAVFTLAANYFNSHKLFNDLLYVVRLSDYLVFLLAAAAISVVVPLVCQVYSVYRLSKIHPNDAMR